MSKRLASRRLTHPTGPGYIRRRPECGSQMTSGMYRAGEIVAERFQLLGEIGSGGMGAVWRARHIVSGENVSLKLLHDDSGDYQSARERFLREARALASLRSPHIVRGIDSGS